MTTRSGSTPLKKNDSIVMTQQRVRGAEDNFPDFEDGRIDLAQYIGLESTSLGSTETLVEEANRPTQRMEAGGGLLRGHLMPLLTQPALQQHATAIGNHGLHHSLSATGSTTCRNNNNNNISNINLNNNSSSNGGMVGTVSNVRHHQPHGVSFRVNNRVPPPYDSVGKLPDSPPETDSGAASAGSPSGSETSPYSPDFHRFNPGHMQGSVIVAGANVSHDILAEKYVASAVRRATEHQLQLQEQHQQQQPGVILNPRRLDANFSDYVIPVQSNARVAANGHNVSAVQMIPNVDFYAGQQATTIQESSPHSAGPPYSPYLLPPQALNAFQQNEQMSRKRPRVEGQQYVKPEPTSPSVVQINDENIYFEDVTHESIRFNDFQKETWNALCDINGRELEPMGFQVIADKGFNYIPFDHAFVNQKKNHFQVTVHILLYDTAEPKFVRTMDGSMRPVSEFQLDIFGVKAEAPSTPIKINQSSTDRKPTPYQPIKINLEPEKVSKATIQRLHFSITTVNNQRKNTRPNPEQKYFYLVVSLNAIVQSNERYVIVASHSEKVIVRASNPGQFDNGESEVQWQRGHNNSIFHQGPVGIGTDKPTSSLTVNGDIHCTGTVYQPSDAQFKENITDVDCAKALQRWQNVRFKEFDWKPEVAEKFGISEEERHCMGVIAQDLQKIMPEAVKDNGFYLTVDNVRLFYEQAAALHELCRMTHNIGDRIEKVESIKKKLEKLARIESVRNALGSNWTLNSKASGSFVSCAPSSNGEKPADVGEESKLNGKSIGLDEKFVDKVKPKRCGRYYQYNRACGRMTSSDGNLCSNKAIQSTVVILLSVMVFCLLAMSTLYFMDWHKRHSGGSAPFYPSGMYDRTPQPDASGVGKTAKKPYGDIGLISVQKSTTTTAKPERLPPGVPPPLHACNNIRCDRFCCGEQSYLVPLYDVTSNRVAPNARIVGEKFRKTRQISADPPQNLRSGDVKNMYDIVDSNRTLKHDISGYAASIRLLSSDNITLDQRYCLTDACNDPSRGNFTYYIPISTYMPHVPLTVKFDVDSKGEVFLCKKATGQLCFGLPTSDDSKNIASVYQVGQNVWKLPIGLYFESIYTFRVGASTTLCSMPSDEAGASFVEYTLWFYRLCNRRH